MSENIRGITFAEQTVTPADDAIVRRAILSDGILSGCNITYSGSTLTMAAGYVIACGRIFQITAAQNWAVVDATSGVARLVLTIDLTKTATETAFDQISFDIEYASAENGFVNLTQDDINIAGVRYQVAVAVVSLGAGGITGIISKLEKAEGGGGLNFKVVAGLTQPGSATENTIWVMAESLTGWAFSADEPEEMSEGEVWISLGVSSPVAFNALRKNELRVYPISASQYLRGVLVSTPAKIFTNGAWQDMIDFNIFDAGEWNGDVVENKGYSSQYSTGTTINISLGDFNGAHVYLGVKKDLSPYKTLNGIFDSVVVNANNAVFGVFVTESVEVNAAALRNGDGTVALANGSDKGTYRLDISELSGDHYVWIGAYNKIGYTMSCEISRFYFE